MNGASYITRINLDADAAHRVTLLATKDSQGHAIAPIDGSTWDPFAKRPLFTTESSSAPTCSSTLGAPSTVTDISGALGRGGYEGIQNDSNGNIWIVEDIGGAKKPGTNAKRPNSFLYRYVPKTPADLAHGKLQALQVLNGSGDPPTTVRSPSSTREIRHTRVLTTSRSCPRTRSRSSRTRATPSSTAITRPTRSFRPGR